MRQILFFFLIILFIVHPALYGISNATTDSIYQKAIKAPENTENLGLLAAHILSNPDWTDEEGLFYARELLRLSEQNNYAYGATIALNHQGYLLEQSDRKLAVEKYEEALRIAMANNFQRMQGTILNNLSIVYAITGEYYQSVQYLLRLLTLAEDTGDTLRKAVALNNIGLRYLDMNNAEISIGFFRRAMRLNTKKGYLDRYATNISNLALAYQMKGMSDSAWHYYKQSIAIHRQNNDFYKLQYGYQALSLLYFEMDKPDQSKTAMDSALYLANLVNDQYSITNLKVLQADLLNRQKRYTEAISQLQEAERKALEMNFRPILVDLYKELVLSHRGLNQFEKAFDYNEKYLALRDSLQNVETKKAQARLIEYEMDKSERERDFLARNIEVQNLTIKRQQLVRNFSILVLFFIFILLVLLWQRFRYIRRTGEELKKKNELIEVEKQRSDGLLQNILPAEIATELKQHGNAKVKHYEMVTVMFIDFVGFSQMAELLEPQQLVNEIDYCFKSFDDITDLHKIEKIKTIGDAYMCAGGLPVADTTNPQRVVGAARDICRFMKNYRQERIARKSPYFEARIGLHTGPVIAGIVGHRKFAYDIWGDTVNIASRMETGGEPGKINISQTTYEFVSDHYACTYRGKIETKNKGFLDMYFVDE